MIKINGVNVFKKCTICKTHYTLDYFTKNRARFDGLESYCRACSLARAQRFVELNREGVNERARKWRESNPEKSALAIKEWQTRNKEKFLERIRICAYARYHNPIPQVCSIEGCDLTGERHHPDYSLPKDIVWLCEKHHRKLHRKVCFVV